MELCDVRFLRRELEEYRLLLEQLPTAGTWQTAALERKLQRTADRLAAELWGVTCFIADIPDTELRLIFELRYFRGCSWPEVATGLPTALSPDGARMKHDRYLKAKSRKSRKGGFSNQLFSKRNVGSVGLSSAQSS